jgi:hypothetical protein
MIPCPRCPDWAVRTVRTQIQRFIYSRAYACPSCGCRQNLYHPFIVKVFVNNAHFILSRHTQCIACGSESVERAGPAASIARNPLGRIQRLIGAPLLACSRCRAAYFDWRSPRPHPTTVAATSADIASDLAALSLVLGQTAPVTDAATSNQPADLTV